ncbi:MAG TPA: family 20 glycosylhydrolase [Chitinophagaceae bacterium]
MKRIFVLLLALSGTAYAQQTPSVNIIPQPVSLQTKSGTFTLSRKTVLAAGDEQDRRMAGLLNEYLQQIYGFQLDVDRQESKDYIRLATRKFIQAPGKDAYTLNVTADGVTIEGDTYAGTFYGLQTLLQLMPALDKKTLIQYPEFKIPQVSIQDHPRFQYRGLHLDVSRHFFPILFIKKYIDYIAFHKMNYFHWHLTDDQGWRIEMKKYPLLNTVAAYRNGTIIGRYPGTGNDNLRYGGYYTQDEVKEIVRYAADRHITVVPEIEMPGHASAAIAAYPWLSCFPQKETVIPSHPSEASKKINGKKVQETWGVFEDIFCAGKDSTFAFLQDVLDEVLPLFPSTYIHVGGDEAPKNHWKACPACQQRIKAENLKDEHELQSYFIQRMEKYLNSKGRTLIGWDEILEGGLAPNAIVMSWRGEAGGIEAARQSHQVIMTPGPPLYFDHSQTKNEDSVVIGGYSPLDRVYNYDPVPKELTAEQAKYILGAQANLWTEYMKYPSKVEYHLFPRLSALSEVLWTPKEQKSWSSFEKRLQAQFNRYKMWGANYSRAYFDLKSNITPGKGKSGVTWKVQKATKDGRIVYRDPTGKQFVSTADSVDIAITRPGTWSAWLIESAPAKGDPNTVRMMEYKEITTPISQYFTLNKAWGKKVSITAAPNEKYPGQQGAFSLVNGVWSNKGLSYPDWLGWVGDDMVATIDLGAPTSFSSVKMHTLEQNGSWVYLPKQVQVLVSNDGRRYHSVGKSSEFIKDIGTMGFITIKFPAQKSRYIKVIATNYGTIPEGKAGAGNKAWLFADEIQVN